jgi:RNA polymerase-binding transcription factor DksA
LRRMKHGGFGICHVCGSSIAAKRLQARPGAIFCLVCQEHSEDRIRFQNSVGDSTPKVCRLQRERCQVA